MSPVSLRWIIGVCPVLEFQGVVIGAAAEFSVNAFVYALVTENALLLIRHTLSFLPRSFGRDFKSLSLEVLA